MAKFKITITVECYSKLSNDDKDYLRRYAVDAIETMQGCHHPDDLARTVFGDSQTKVICKELEEAV